MQNNQTDLLNTRVWLMLVMVGAFLLLAGWFRFFGA
jgi:hypothetical protein